MKLGIFMVDLCVCVALWLCVAVPDVFFLLLLSGLARKMIRL